ncbi:hypothetical protein [Amycolatopsis suaedae]|uniref:Alpha/beta hydrolase n=1 Tax=Amycolatopsis suaedae TaxID=2510978 RepID=A0A4Q7J4A6_9PSEU|nr:hypothetical protein [Amycolatopsis suaedae]RZQ61516.1 hypothetical protein EWH70_24440 [Amycolatopsis suaedae]
MTRLRAALVCVASAVLLAGLTPAAAAGGGGPSPADCPEKLPAGTRCFGGKDAAGAYYLIAFPRSWNGTLVMHAHGGPDLGAASPERTSEDLSRWAVMVDQGYAWAGSSYRRGGYGTRMGAEDTENLRRLFGSAFGTPRRTLLHGQSWGGNIAAKTAELYGRHYAGVLLTNGAVAGGTRGYNHRVDLRVVYQYYCRNHPRPDEPQYPLWTGLPADSAMTTADLRARLQECTGYQSPPERRTAVQQRNLSDILAVTRIPERTLASHLQFATFTFRDMVGTRLGGRNPFSNVGVRYTGSHDDAALNRGVARFAADPAARRDLAYDSDLTGEVPIPVLSLHAIDDPTVFVEQESAYRATLRATGRSGLLVQTFTREREHSALSPSGYAAAVDALQRWIDTGRAPTPASVAAACPAFDARYGTGCHFDPGYRPAAFEDRVAPRPGQRHWPAMSGLESWLWSHIPGVGIKP